MTNWTVRDLEYWDERIREKVAEIGLDCYPQEFEVCDQNSMLGYMAYHGMPSHYPHWSFGKAFEQTKTMYDHGVSGLPYEMVINSNPCLAYLMRDNSLCLQILTIAHVYGHNDFFKNNFTFSSATDAKETIASFKARADRVRALHRGPLDRRRGGRAVPRRGARDLVQPLAQPRDQEAEAGRAAPAPARRRAAGAGPVRPAAQAPGARAGRPHPKEPLEPEADILLFIRDHNRDLADWQKDLLTIVDEEARYFLPQIETKIMNEGWASHWHHRIMTSLDLPQEILLEFMVRHNQVICPHPGGLNPYHVGFMVWRDIEKRFGGEHTEEGRAKLMEVRETERDVSFLRRFLTEELCRELDLFTWKPRGEHLVVSEVADEEHWDDVKNALLEADRHRLDADDPHPRRQLQGPPRPLPGPRA